MCVHMYVDRRIDACIYIRVFECMRVLSITFPSSLFLSRPFHISPVLHTYVFSSRHLTHLHHASLVLPTPFAAFPHLYCPSDTSPVFSILLSTSPKLFFNLLPLILPCSCKLVSKYFDLKAICLPQSNNTHLCRNYIRNSYTNRI